MTEPPASDADLPEWAAWARSVGKGHLDPERLRFEARRLRDDPLFGLREPAAGSDVALERPVLTVDPGPVTRDERMALVFFLTETASRAAAGTAGRSHPAVVAIGVLADALRSGQGPLDVQVTAGRHDREMVFGVLQAALARARSERLGVAEPLRCVLAGVERWAYGERGWQPAPARLSPEHDAAWNDDGGLFRGGR